MILSHLVFDCWQLPVIYECQFQTALYIFDSEAYENTIFYGSEYGSERKFDKLRCGTGIAIQKNGSCCEKGTIKQGLQVTSFLGVHEGVFWGRKRLGDPPLK